MTATHLVALILGGGSAVLLAALAVLIARRGWQERARRRAARRGEAFREALLPLLIDSAAPATDALAAWRGDPAALEVCSHFLELLRGGERQRLLAAIDRLGLVAAPMRQMRSPRTARRVAAVRALAAIALPNVCAGLTRAMAGDPSLEVRLEAGLALVRHDAAPTLGEALRWLDDGAGLASPAHRIILRALAAADPAAMVAAWQAERCGAARLALTDALGAAAGGAAVGALRAALGDPDPQMRCEALRALRRIGDPGVAPDIVAALDDPEWIVRVQAAVTAGAMALGAAAPRLRALTRDPEWWVRHRAEEALALFLRQKAAA